MKTAKFEYKCRRCGEVFTPSGIGVESAPEILLYRSLMGSGELPLTATHQCVLADSEDDCRGVADLIGYQVDK